VRSPEATDAGQLTKIRSAVVIVGHTPESQEFECFLKQFLQLAIDLQVHGICPFEENGFITKIV
jgi:hypothetical protein